MSPKKALLYYPIDRTGRILSVPIIRSPSLRAGFRLLSAYALPDGTRLWIITEANRSYTTLLLPEEY